MKRLIKLYIKDIDKHFDKHSGYKLCREWLTNARISIENIESELRELFNLEIGDWGYGRQIKKSPYSYSFYIDLWDINDHNKTYSLRISNHLANNYSDDMLVNIITDNFNVSLNSIHKKEIKQIISMYDKSH